MQSANAPDLNATAQTLQTGLTALRQQTAQFAADIDRQHEAFINRTGQTYQFQLPSRIPSFYSYEFEDFA